MRRVVIRPPIAEDGDEGEAGQLEDTEDDVVSVFGPRAGKTHCHYRGDHDVGESVRSSRQNPCQDDHGERQLQHDPRDEERRAGDFTAVHRSRVRKFSNETFAEVLVHVTKKHAEKHGDPDR